MIMILHGLCSRTGYQEVHEENYYSFGFYQSKREKKLADSKLTWQIIFEMFLNNKFV